MKNATALALLMTACFSHFVFAINHESDQPKASINQESAPNTILAWLWDSDSNKKDQTLQNDETSKQDAEKINDVVIAMNYLTASLVKISTYNDKVILTQEYDEIINNINLNKIHDQETIDQILVLMDYLTNLKLSSAEQKIIRNRYETNVKYALHEAKEKSRTQQSSSYSGENAAVEIIALLANSLTKIGSEQNDYQKNLDNYRNELEENSWKLDKENIKKLNEIRKQFISSLWSVLRNHNISDEKRLTEVQFNNYFKILKDKDVSARYRKLLRIESSFSNYPFYWYFRGVAAQELNNKKDAIKSFGKVEKTDNEFFRKNSLLSSAAINHVQLLDKNKDHKKIKELLNIAIKESPLDGRKNLFVALKLAQLGKIDQALERVQVNLDSKLFEAESKRVKGLLLSKKGDHEEFRALAQEMLADDSIRMQDILFMFGPDSSEKVLQELIPRLIRIRVEFDKTIIPFRKDNLVILLPIKWVLDDMASFQISAALDNNSLKLKDLSITDDGDFMIATFPDVLSISEFLNSDAISQLVISLEHISGSYQITYKITTEEITMEAGMWEKWHKTARNSVEQISEGTKSIIVGFTESEQEDLADRANTRENDKKNEKENLVRTEKVIEASLSRIESSAGLCFYQSDEKWSIQECK